MTNTIHRSVALLLAGATALVLAGLAGSTTSGARLRAQPPMVPVGNPLTVSGSGFAPRVRVTLFIGRPNSSKTARLGTIRANRKGGFKFVKTISRSTGAGLWVVRACQRSCRTKASARFRVAKIKPL